jgi:hypothetical protein
MNIPALGSRRPNRCCVADNPATGRRRWYGDSAPESASQTAQEARAMITVNRPLNRPFLRYAALIVAAIGLPAAISNAQTGDDSLNTPALDKEAEQLSRPTPPPLEVAPADSSITINAAAPFPKPALIREGAVLSQRHGILRRMRSGGWAFLSTRPDDGSRIALILMPSTRLTEMTRLVESSPDPISFEVTGQVFAYQGRNYVLPTRFRTGSVDDIVPQSEAPSATPAPSSGNGLSSNGQQSDAEPTIDDLLATVEDRSGPQGESSAAPQSDMDESLATDSEHGLALLREGVVISARLGRLRPATTTAGSGWMLVADADADTGGDALATLPLLMLPCQNLTGMERLVADHGDTLRFTVSGVIYVYDGQNYLLPTMYLVELDRSGNLTSAQ